MSLEFILWFASWIVISEIIFIVILLMTDTEVWGEKKVASFFGGAAFMMIQFMITYIPYNCPFDEIKSFCFDYGRLLYELYFIVGVLLLFGLNKLIVMGLEKLAE